MPNFAFEISKDLFDMANKLEKKKQNGEVFTPMALAEFLAGRLMKYLMEEKRRVVICDPSCGDGVLLRAMTDAFIKNGRQNIAIHGIDQDEEYLKQAQCNLQEEFPDLVKIFEKKDFVEERANSLFGTGAVYNLIIGNPPYVRTQTLGNEKSQALLKLYGLSGRVDLYYPFLINMTESLVEGGLLGVITSNRYLTTKSGESIRKYLLENYDILEVIDLGDTKLFDAAVLPAIFIGRKNSSPRKDATGKFLKIYENLTGEEITGNAKSVYDILQREKTGCFKAQDNGISYKMSVGEFTRPKSATDIWQMNTENEQDLIKIIRQHTKFFIGDKFKVRVGVKSCADDVFFESSCADVCDRIEDVFYRELISQENISAWSVSIGLKQVIYPHYDDNGRKNVFDISKYPKAKAFFLVHESRLKKRSYLINSNRKWYEYWVPQNPILWKYPKLVFPDISVEPRFAIDKSGAIVNGNCYWIYAADEEELDLLYLIEGVANSSLMTVYHDLCFNNKLYSGRRRYLTQYVEKYPVPDPDSEYSKRIIALAKQLYDEKPLRHQSEMIAEINECVKAAFGVVYDS